MATIGVLGGNGTFATLNFIRELVDKAYATGDSSRPRFILYNLPPQENDSFVYDGNLNLYSPKNDLVKAARKIENAGAKVLVMPCNSLHYFHKDIQKRIQIKFLSIIEVTVDRIKETYTDAKNVAVLGTSVTIQKGLYKEVLSRSGLNQLELPDFIQDKLLTCLFNGDTVEDVEKNKNLMQQVIDYVVQK